MTRSAPAWERNTAVAGFILVSAAYAYAAASRSMSQLNMDEVLAVSAAQQPSIGQVWRAIWSGTDFSPPSYHVLLHALSPAAGAGRWLWRAPSVVAVYAAGLCAWSIARARFAPWAGVLSLALVLGLGLFEFAVLARQYALLTLGLALALQLWAAESRNARFGVLRALGLWLVLSLCLCLHFYGFIEVGTIGAAELMWAIRYRRIRLPVWLALSITAPVEAALYPLAAHLARFNAGDNGSAGYYAKPGLGHFAHACFDALLGGKFGVVLIVIAVAVVGGAYLAGGDAGRPIVRAEPVRDERARSSALAIILIALCLIPPAVFAFSLITKSFSPRYMAPAALFPALAAPYLLDRLTAGRIAALALVAVTAALLVYRAHAPDPTAQALDVARRSPPNYPLVVGEGGLYIELMQAADPATRSRLVYLKRPPGAPNPDPTNENEVTRLASFHTDYQVSDQAAFLAAHRRFFVLYRPNYSTDTTTPSLIQKNLLAGQIDAPSGVFLLKTKTIAGDPR